MLSNDYHMMIDLETLSTHPNAMVLSVGACVFNQGRVAEWRHWVLDRSKQHRRRIDVSSVEWWMGQGDQAKAAVFNIADEDLINPYQMRNELVGLATQYNVVKWWAHSPSFDMITLNSLLNEEVFPFRDWLDTRTIMWASGTKMTRDGGTAHNAADDAIRQAQYLIDLFKQGGWVNAN